MSLSTFDKLAIGAFTCMYTATAIAMARSLITKKEEEKNAFKPVPKEDEEDAKVPLERADSLLNEERKADITNHVYQVESFLKDDSNIDNPNPMVVADPNKIKSGRFLTYKSCIPSGAFTIEGRQYRSEKELLEAPRYKKAGPKTHLYYDPSKVKAAIVTCGGVCPGENAVIREVVMMLHYGYGVREIYGVKYGFEGFYKRNAEGEDCYVKLVPELLPTLKRAPKDIIPVKDLHNKGGTVLGGSRGGFDAEKIAHELITRGINQVYAIGGDGTHCGLLSLSKVLKKKGVKITLIGIPKAIDNDMPIVDKTFGFDSAVEVAMWAIQCADVEANSAEYGVGIVKVKGVYAGHIAMHAALANRDVNVCLIPESPFDCYGQKGLLEYVISRLKKRNHCVIVVSEGAASAMRDVKLTSTENDASGSPIPGVFFTKTKLNRILENSYEMKL